MMNNQIMKLLIDTLTALMDNEIICITSPSVISQHSCVMEH
jgi:hypothetical protein